MLGLAGVTPIDTRVAAVTLNMVDPAVPPSVAEIVADPGLKPEATPFVPIVLLTAAIAGAEELQLTKFERSCAELSL